LSSRINPVASQEAPPGLQTLLKTTDFGEWDHAVSNSLGHHRSRLLPQSPPFAAQMRSGAVEEVKVLLLQGSGQVELLREQAGHDLPMVRGVTQPHTATPLAQGNPKRPSLRSLRFPGLQQTSPTTIATLRTTN